MKIPLPRARVALLLAAASLLLTTVTACGDDDSDGGSGGGGKISAAGYGGVTPDSFKKHFFEPYQKDTGAETTWTTVPGGVVAGVSAQQDSGNVQWDVLFAIDAGSIAQLAADGRLEKLPADVAAANADLPDANEYYTPYAYGASIIVCNKEAVDRCPTSASEFLDVDNFPGKRSVASFLPVTALALAAEANGASPDEVWDQPLESMEDTLKAARSSITTFWNSGDEANRLVSSGEVPICLCSSSNVHSLVKDDTSDKYAVSWTDGVKFGVYMGIVKDGPNKAGAEDLMKWIIDHPQAQADEITGEGGASLATKGANDLLPDDIREWVPDSEGKTGLVVENADWYLQNKAAVDEFWKEFTGA